MRVWNTNSPFHSGSAITRLHTVAQCSGDGSISRHPTPTTNLPDVVTIAHLSDVHMGSTTPSVLDALVADVHHHQPDVVVVSGDLTMRARKREFAAARNFLARLPQPQLVVIGNHDVPLYDLTTRFTAPYSRYRRELSDDLDPVLDVPGARLLGLQSMPRWRWKSGRVSSRQAALVSTVFTAPQQHDQGPDSDATPTTPALRVLVLHHPPSLSGLATMAKIGSLDRALARGRVDVVLAGHTHIPRVSEYPVHHDRQLSRVVEVVCGTSASSRTRGAPMAWMIVQADAANISVTARIRADQNWEIGGLATFARQRHDV